MVYLKSTGLELWFEKKNEVLNAYMWQKDLAAGGAFVFRFFYFCIIGIV